MTDALISHCLLCDGAGGSKGEHKAPCEEAGRETQPRARDFQKDMDLIVLQSLKSIRKLWKGAGLSNIQKMQNDIVTVST